MLLLQYGAWLYFGDRILRNAQVYGQALIGRASEHLKAVGLL